jgi:hypothetical protein
MPNKRAAALPPGAATDNLPDATRNAPAPNNANGAGASSGYRAVVAVALAAVGSMAMLQ